MNSQIKQLTNYIKDWGRVDYDYVASYAYRINKFWRAASWERALRARSDIQAIYKGIPRKSPIIAWRFIKSPEPEIKKEPKQTGFLDIRVNR